MTQLTAIEINKQIRKLVDGKLSHLPYDKRANIIASTLGFAVGTQLPIPTSPVEKVDEYIATAFMQASNLISKVNEAFVIDTNLSVSTAKAVLRFRYDSVFNPQSFFTFLLAKTPAAAVGLCGETMELLSQCDTDTLYSFSFLIDNLTQSQAIG